MLYLCWFGFILVISLVWLNERDNDVISKQRVILCVGKKLWVLWIRPDYLELFNKNISFGLDKRYDLPTDLLKGRGILTVQR